MGETWKARRAGTIWHKGCVQEETESDRDCRGSLDRRGSLVGPDSNAGSRVPGRFPRTCREPSTSAKKENGSGGRGSWQGTRRPFVKCVHQVKVRFFGRTDFLRVLEHESESCRCIQPQRTQEGEIKGGGSGAPALARGPGRTGTRESASLSLHGLTMERCLLARPSVLMLYVVNTPECKPGQTFGFIW